MKRKVMNVVKVALGNLVLVGLLSGCGDTADLDKAENVNQEIAESITVAESEFAILETELTTEATTVAGKEEEATETTLVDKNEEVTVGTVVTPESGAASEERDIVIEFNGGYYEGTLQETTEDYIKYEDMEPATMYVINNTTGEQYPIYNDPNVTEGTIMMGGIVEANQELLIDGKATYKGVDYYRIAYKEGTMLTFQLIIPAEYVVPEP